jgi:dolichyl-phosphate beta-glucosyltransferase
MTTLSLVIPAYNEEARLSALLEALNDSGDAAVAKAGLELAEIVVVDDGSTDATAAILREAAAGEPRLKPVLRYPENRGKGAAVAVGVDSAEGDFVLVADVDLSTPLNELHKLTAAIDRGADIAIGSRALPESVVDRGPVHRKLTGAAFNRAVRLLTGLKIRDTQCGFKLFPAATAKQLLESQLCPGFAFDVEMLMRAELAGLHITEVPVVYIHDSRSRVRVAPASFRMLKDISKLALRMRPDGNEVL